MKICLSCEGVTNTPAQRCGHCGAWLLPTDAVHYPVRRGELDAGNPLLGTLVDGKYRLLGVLGRGGLGTVFRAQHIGSLATVALKLLHPRFAERPEYRRALLPEARRAAAVTNDHCARLLDVGEAELGVAYLAMELVDGRTLDLVVRDGPLPPSTAVQVLLQVATALVAIHGQGLVHCDLSPRNVMVGMRDGVLRVKVLDFGIARSVTLAGAAAPAGEFKGFVNPAFAAPELLAGGDVGPSADLYSFGTLAWLLLTGTMPIDDTDSRRAAAAVRAGELAPWPKVPGVPRRLGRLVQACLQLQPQARPASAAVVQRELAAILGARRGPLVRVAVAAAAAAVLATVATMAGGVAAPPFLRPWSGALALNDGPLAADAPALDLTSDRLATLGFVYGGFAPRRLHAVLARDGAVLLRKAQAPEIDPDADTLLLSTAQAEWRDVVTSLVRTSQQGPVDLSFVVPGAAPLGTTRLRLDDEPPRIDAVLRPAGERLLATSQLVATWHDDVAVAAAAVCVSFASGRELELPLPLAGGEFELGRALAAAVDSVDALGAGELRVIASDRAGNHSEAAPLSFAAADFAAPVVKDTSGPAGEPFVPVVDGQVRLRVRLSASEPDCTLEIEAADGQRTGPLPLTGPGPVHTLDCTLPGQGEVARLLRFHVADAAGNTSSFESVVALRERTLLPAWQPEHGARWTGTELVLAPDGASVVAGFGATWNLASARLESAEPSASGAVEVAHVEAGASARRLQFGELVAGRHTLRCDLLEGSGDQGLRRLHSVPVRVLPAVVEVRLPAVRSRFLPALLEAGVLARRGNALVEGAGWLFDPALRPYLRGSLWVGEPPVALPLRAASGPGAAEPLLPEVVPVPGRNVLAIELRDLLDRPVRLQFGEAAREQVPVAAGPRPLADFWWHDRRIEPIGAEILVEYGQSARLGLRCPWPFTAEECAQLQLRLRQDTLPASAVESSPEHGATVWFTLPFAVWSAAAQLADLPRDSYQNRLLRQVDAEVATPAGSQQLQLQLRTARSTLVAIELAQLADRRLAPALAALRLLPVLAPSAPFAEPVPKSAPPRSAFRPQVEVAVRNMSDLLLQDREFPVAAARELAAGTTAALTAEQRRRCVHHADVLGVARLEPGNLLPIAAWSAPAGAAVTGVDFFQAYTLTRLLGFAVVGDPEAFRLPLGCELELAAFSGATRPACHGAAAHGGRVRMAAFVARGAIVDANTSAAAGDLVPTPFGAEFHGLDFGVAEWVFDLPHFPSAEMLMIEWIGDHQRHLERVQKMADGDPEAVPDPVGPLRQLGVVRGLAFAQPDGLLGRDGARLDPAAFAEVPLSVPGVLRTEQLQRDGRALLGGGREPRLQHIGFRVVGAAATVARLRGRR